VNALAEKLDRWREDLPCLPVTITKNKLYADSVVVFSSHRTELLRLSDVIAVVEIPRPDDWNQILDKLDQEAAAVKLSSVRAVEHRYHDSPDWHEIDKFSLKIIAYGLSNYPGVAEMPSGFSESEIKADTTLGAVMDLENLLSRPQGSKSCWSNANITLKNLLAAVVRGLRSASPAAKEKPKSPRKYMTKQDVEMILSELLKVDPAKYAGMSQRALAKEIGCSRETLRKTEACKSIAPIQEKLRNEKMA